MFQPILHRARGLFGARRGDRKARAGASRRRGPLQGRRRRTPSIESLEPRVVLTGGVLISELLASNDTGLNDEDGETSDWIELLNITNNVIDLNGWYLTDDAGDLTKWQFPERPVAAGEMLVVFASGKDRNEGEELHTNFRLSSGGEFLAMVEPDGITISDQYDPYPEQFSDVSYGPQQERPVTQFVTTDSETRLLTPNSVDDDLPASTWTAVSFDDTAWSTANYGVGYDTVPEDGDFNTLLGAGGDLSAMQGETASAYLRSSFQIDGDQVPEFTTLGLDIHYDDGFVAYLNGTEVARSNAPDSLAWDSTATEEHGGIIEHRIYDDFSSTSDFVLLGDARELFGRLQVTASQQNQTGAIWTKDEIAFGADYSFATSMAIDVYSDGSGGGEGMTFALQSGGASRLGVGGGGLGLDNSGMPFVAVEFDSYRLGSWDEGERLSYHIGINTSASDQAVARVAVDRFNDGNVGQNVRYAWVAYNGVSDQMDVYFSENNTRPDTPAITATVDLEALFGGVPTLWAGWTAATSARINAHDVVRWEFISGAGQLGMEPVPVDISEHIGLLQPGKNVLAVHGLNLTADDEDFLISANLSATQTLLTEPAYFSVPTPGQANGAGGPPPSEDVIFSVDTQVFYEPFTVEISSASPNAQIRYTTDGKIPDETSTLYTDPIEISESVRIRARAFEENRAPGVIANVGYTLADDALVEFENGQSFESNLPLMIFDSNGGRADSNSSLFVPVTAIFISPGEDGRANLFDEPDSVEYAGLRIRGQTSQGFAKKPYALEIWEEGPWQDTIDDSRGRVDGAQGVDKSISLFGLPSESDWVLNGPYSDKTQFNNYLSFQWSNEMGLYAPRTRLVEVFVNDNGGELDFRRDYRGTYVLMEKIKIDENRVDITKMSPTDNSEPEITGGYIWKKDKNGANDVNFRTSRGQDLKLVEPDYDEYTAEQLQWLTNHINEFEAALYGPDFKDPEIGYANYIDVDSWIDTWILVEMTKQIDGFRLSTYYYKDRGGKIQQGPPWDYNLSLVNANYNTGAFPEGWYKDVLNTTTYPYWDRLFEDPEFYQRLVDRWQELRQTIFTTEEMMADIDAAVDLISDGNPNYEQPAEGEPSNPISRNVERWGTSYFTSYQWPNCFFGTGSCPRSPLLDIGDSDGRPDSYADYIFVMKDFLEQRLQWMDNQFLAAPTFDPEGGNIGDPIEVTMVAERGSIIYSTDGSDPRAIVVGGLPGDVHEYTEPIPVTKNMHFVARAYDSNTEEWSGPVSSSYVIDTPRLAITEMNYHPYEPTAEEVAAGFTNRDDFEFIEIQNVGANTPDLIHTRFADGVQFEFSNVDLAPGAYGVIVSNLAAFQARYGTQIPVLGEYTDNLNNAGERVTLVSATDDVLLDFVYGDSSLWPRSADGVGASLQSIRPALTPAGQMGKYYRWQGSTEFGGTPGSAGTQPMGIAINEVLSNPPADGKDAIELYNPTGESIDVSGWYLSDSSDNPLKYQIPDGTVIGPGDFWVVDETEFNGEDAGDNGFGLSGSLGDDVWLVVADGASGVSAFVDDVRFGAAVQGESFGRVPDGSGRLAPMTAVTLGALNAAPRVGPVVISELNYHPGAPSEAAIAEDPSVTRGDLEFVEIHNPTDAEVNLDNWRIRGGIGFDFEQATILRSGAVLVVISFDPLDPANASRLAAFRAEYGLGENVPLVGGYQGQLSNSAEQVQLQRPGEISPDDPTVIPRLLEDEVVYDDLPPWPTEADGLGSTLTRAELAAWGNDSQSWVAARPSPGSIVDFVPLPGDANLDRKFDQKDIVQVLMADKYGTGEPATWSEGDWTGDGVFDQLDIVASLQEGHYLQGPYAAQSEGRFATGWATHSMSLRVVHAIRPTPRQSELC